MPFDVKAYAWEHRYRVRNVHAECDRIGWVLLARSARALRYGPGPMRRIPGVVVEQEGDSEAAGTAPVEAVDALLDVLRPLGRRTQSPAAAERMRRSGVGSAPHGAHDQAPEATQTAGGRAPWVSSRRAARGPPSGEGRTCNRDRGTAADGAGEATPGSSRTEAEAFPRSCERNANETALAMERDLVLTPVRALRANLQPEPHGRRLTPGVWSQPCL